MGTTEERVLKVSSHTSAKQLASSIFACKANEKPDRIVLRSVGAGAINQMVKAFIIAKGMLLQKGFKTTMDLRFGDIVGKEEEGSQSITAIELVINFE